MIIPKTTKGRVFFVIVIVVIITGFFAYAVFKGEDAIYTTAEVMRGDIEQTVAETGTVKSVKEIDLNFLTAGRMASLAVEVGAKVAKGERLASLDATNFFITQQQEEANLLSAQANLSKMLSGSTREDVAVSQAAVDQAKAAYEAAIEELAKTRATHEEALRQAEKTLSDLQLKDSVNITPQEKAVDQAQINLNNVESTYSQAIISKQNNIQIIVEDKNSVAYNSLSDIKSILNDEKDNYFMIAANPSYRDNTVKDRNAALALWAKAVDALTAAKAQPIEQNLYNAADASIYFLNATLTSLRTCFIGLDNSITSAAVTQAALDAYKTTVNDEVVAVNAALSLVQSAKQDLVDAVLAYHTNLAAASASLDKAKVDLADAIISAQYALNSAQTSADEKITAAESKVSSTLQSWQSSQKDLAKVRAGYNIYDIEAARADVKRYEASLAKTKQEITDSIIISPIDGTITKVDFEVGEYVSPTSRVLSILEENNFEVEVDISESDIAKISLGDLSHINLDAFGQDVVFLGRVTAIEPAETIIQDVVYYKAKIEFLEAEHAAVQHLNLDNEELDAYRQYLNQIKPGMTANISINTAQRTGVLLVPFRAVITKNGSGKIVRVLDRQNNIHEVPVTVGLRGDNGMIEIIAGVNEGDKVIIFIQNNN